MVKRSYQFSDKRLGTVVRMSDGWAGKIMGEADGLTMCLERGKPNELENYRTFGPKCMTRTKGTRVTLVEKVIKDGAGEIYVKLRDQGKQFCARKIAQSWDSAPTIN